MSRLDEWARAPHSVRFTDLCREAERLGFELKGGRGSHRVYAHPVVREILTLQPDKSGKAKPYQIRQLRDLVERYELG